MATYKTDDDGQKTSIVDEARECWRTGSTRDQEITREFNLRMRYRAGDQWDPKDIANRGKDRPAVVINLLEQPIQQVVNANILNRPGGKVSPADEVATAEVAEALQGRIQHVEYASNSNVAYATCIGYVAAGGHGLVGLTVDYVSPDSLDQECRIREIKDPANWCLDRSNKEPDGSDRRWAIGRERYSVEEFKRLWPGKTVVDASFYTESADYADWGDGEDVWVAEYWRLEYRKRKLQRYSDGSIGFTDDARFLKRLPPGARPMKGKANSAEKDWPYVVQYLVSGAEVLEETPWPGRRIPIFECIANEFYAEGRRVEKSLISDSLDAQRSYNCSESLKLEAMALAPKPKWLMTTEQVQGHEAEWKRANTSTDAALFYNGLLDSRGNPVPPPNWHVFEPPVQAFSVVSAQSKQDVKDTSGFSNTALGQYDTRRQSGTAIEALQSVSGQGTVHYAETFGQTLKPLYLEIIAIEQELHSGPQPKSLRVIKPDGKHKMVRVNDPTEAKPVMINAGGRFDVLVSTGPSFKDQRDAASSFISDVQQHDPEGWQLVRDIGARLKEPELGHYADEMAERWTPPQFQQKDPNAPPLPPLPPQVQKQLALIPQLTQQLHNASDVIEQKKVEQQGQFERDMAKLTLQYQIEQLKADTTLRAAELSMKNDTMLAEVNGRIWQIELAIGNQHDMAKASADAGHEEYMARLSAQQQQQQQQQQPAGAPSEPNAAQSQPPPQETP